MIPLKTCFYTTDTSSDLKKRVKEGVGARVDSPAQSMTNLQSLVFIGELDNLSNMTFGPLLTVIQLSLPNWVYNQCHKWSMIGNLPNT